MLVRKSELIQVERMKKCRVKPKVTLVEVVKRGMFIKEVTNSMISNRE